MGETSWPTGYSAFPALQAQRGELTLRPIRWEDRTPIRIWRNQQIGVLRQRAPLTREEQDHYYLEIVLPQLGQAAPEQILLGFLEAHELVGYGGLVHIDWDGLSAEVSFLNATPRSQGKALQIDWIAYLELLIPLARDVVGLVRLTTETYETRPDLIGMLEGVGFTKGAKSRIPLGSFPPKAPSQFHTLAL